ncbi:hypothetical protein H1D32_07750 [Anaerobacillus sp. CMMVII]|uniref:DUF5667 domain-containing protein n=1 Tax=Anaerobacillus sp. CMMVII TaxID=2755588 RepID=UPI0021B7759E|nr:DUF5667 domain-containing protein [Anaerobacillus sp. CMMVII]MCT8137656.1 hypothetical protein [Anaerobacillus sp. CMMVII]
MSKHKIRFSKNVRNVLATSVITTALAFTSVTGQVYAGNQEVEVDVTVEEVTDEDSIYETTEGEVVEVDVTLEVEEDVEGETPALLPGDFLYFAKKVLETVKLALTFDDVKKAELLILFSQERIKEVEALLAEGKVDLASEALQRAIEKYEEALDKYGDTEETTEEQEGTEEEGTEELDGSEEALEDEEITEDETTEGEEEVLENDEATEEEDQLASIRAELEAKFSKNILALQAALEKVTNPQAKESLQKNIVKHKKSLK